MSQKSPREAQRSPEKPRDAQRGPERLWEAQKSPERPREAQRGPERSPQGSVSDFILQCPLLRPREAQGKAHRKATSQPTNQRQTCKTKWINRPTSNRHANHRPINRPTDESTADQPIFDEPSNRPDQPPDQPGYNNKKLYLTAMKKPWESYRPLPFSSTPPTRNLLRANRLLQQ